jgi:hypothetical protein
MKRRQRCARGVLGSNTAAASQRGWQRTLAGASARGQLLCTRARCRTAMPQAAATRRACTLALAAAAVAADVASLRCWATSPRAWQQTTERSGRCCITRCLLSSVEHAKDGRHQPLLLDNTPSLSGDAARCSTHARYTGLIRRDGPNEQKRVRHGHRRRVCGWRVRHTIDHARGGAWRHLVASHRSWHMCRPRLVSQYPQ